jgi:hypothetical protein
MAGRGSAPGERRGGRQKGTRNHATAEIKELARNYAPEAVQTLARIMREGDSDTSKIAAAKELIDRGYGKATQPISGADGGPLSLIVATGLPDASKAD